MSCSKWAYIPSRCDGEPCPGDCDNCVKADDNVALMDGMKTDRAIKLLEELRDSYGWGDVIINSDDAEALTMAIEALKRDRWIPCEERLPEKYGEYMILWKPKSYRTKTLFYEITEYEDGEWIGTIPQSKPYGGYEVFYWRELPAEPPKEDKLE